MRKHASALVSTQSPQFVSLLRVLTGTSDAKYRVQDYKVPVEGGEITVRAVIPGTEDEGQKYPLLFWAHGGGQFSGMFGLESIELIVFSPFPF
jgi:dipeptidyl aminopeptidase/acylaminoacyl peptidase